MADANSTLPSTLDHVRADVIGALSECCEGFSELSALCKAIIDNEGDADPIYLARAGRRIAESLADYADNARMRAEKGMMQ